MSVHEETQVNLPRCNDNDRIRERLYAQMGVDPAIRRTNPGADRIEQEGAANMQQAVAWARQQPFPQASTLGATRHTLQPAMAVLCLEVDQ